MVHPALTVDETSVHVLIFVAGVIFSAGISYGTLARVRRDVDGIGRKQNDADKTALRRYHNCSLAILQAAPTEKESEISRLLKEECNS